ncbi:MAG: polysaccharide export protein [Elusimicrobia bacterium]|nr:polysaccharide export protein [Elusimicrobiota bacterium]
MRGYRLIFVLPLILCACSGPQKKAETSAQQEIIEKQQLESALEAIGKSKLDYKIQPGDLLEISVYQEKDMDRTVRVSGNGAVSFPLAGSLSMAGLSVPQAEEMLAEKLSQYLVSPQVTMLIREYGNKQVYVLGEVKKPGSLEIPAERNLTVLEAITMAGGFTEIAAQDRTKILRSENGKSRSIEIEISRITKRGDKAADIYLEPNDVVFVPQSFF